MTLRAMDRDTGKGAHGIGHHVISVEMPRDLAVDFSFGKLSMTDEIPRPGGEKSQRDDSITGARKKNVSRDLLFDETRVSFISIQRTNDIIAIRPRIRPRLIFVVAMRVAVVDDVQPMPRPALSIPRRLQHL